ncbi:MAG: PPC domain-containing protein [Acidobacteriota bacterium]
MAIAQVRVRLVVLAAAVVCCAAGSRAADAVGPLRYSAADRDAVKRAARLQLPSLHAALPDAVEYRLAPLSNDELPRLVPDDKPPVAGVHRKLTEEAVDSGQWQTLADGRQVWRLAIRSPEAAGLRLHFTGFSAGSGRVWIHDGSREESEIQGPYTGRGPWGDADFWSDFVLAETVIVEFEPERPESAGQPPPFRIAEVSHLFAGVLPVSAAATRSAAASCHLDVSCYPEWAETAKSVGHIVYEEDGNAYVCSGTLLNTRNRGGIPYFLTADHCVNKDSVARTVQSFWFYQTRTCNAPPASRRDATRTLGATYLGGNGRDRGDFSLLRLNEVPSGVVFSGWDPQEVPDGASLTGIHHPSGEYKRIWFGTRASGRPPFGSDPAAFLTFDRTTGLAEPGSSGSGLFSAPEVLVGVLSHGPKVENSETMCMMSPLRVNYGKFSNAYPVLRDLLEDRTTSPPPPPASTAKALASGVPQSFSLDAVSSPTLFTGSLAYQIAVPQGATRLEIRLATSTANVNADLYARFGSEPAVASGRVVADHSATESGGSETLVVTATSSPALRQGTYYISVAVLTPNVAASGTITATVTTAPSPPPPSGGPTALTSGVARNFTIGPVTTGTLFNGDRGYTISVPQGATRLEIRLLTATPNVDIDLFARFGADTTISGDKAVADHSSEGAAGDETIIITSTSTPPLRAGTYYISLALFTREVTASGTLTATVTTAAPPPAGGPATLTSGTPRSFTIAAVSSADLLTGSRAYQITVPQGATRLDVRLTTATPGVDIDLFVRYGSEPAVVAGRVQADYDSSGAAGEESISITANSTPALRPGTYYIAMAIFTTGVSASGTLTATVTTTAAPPPGAGPITLTSGAAQNFTIGPVSSAALLNATRSYLVNVPQGATRLEIQLATATPDVDVDLFARFGADLSVADGRVVADHRSEGPAGQETITITASSTPPLRPGTYYIAMALFTANVTVSGSLRATVGTAAPPPAPTGPTVLASGRPQNFSIGPYSVPTLVYGNAGYVIDVPQGATRLDIQLATTTSGVDVDLFARYGVDTTIADGEPVADHNSTGPAGSERITITPNSSPPLQPGRYYISLAIYTTGVTASGTLTATVSTAAAPVPAPTTTTVVTSGVPAKFSLPAVEAPTLFTGSYSFRITVPEGSANLKVQVASAVPAIDVDVYVRYESDVDLSPDGEVIADYGAEGETGNEMLAISAASSPPLRPGTYYIALALYTTGTASSGTVTATVERASIAPPVSATRALVSGVPAQFSLPDVGQPTFFSGQYGFRIVVPPASGKLEISLRTDTAGADVDLFARFGAEPELVNGRIVADYGSTSDTGNEYLTIGPLAVPPLRSGVYFIAMALYTPGLPAQGTITATVTPADRLSAPALLKSEPPEAPPGLPLEPKRGWAVAVPIPAALKEEAPAELFKQSDRPAKKKPGRYTLYP